MFRKLLYLATIIIINYTLFITHCHAQWVQQNLPYNATVVDVHFFNGNTGLVKQSSPSKYLRTTDGGSNWISLNDTNYVGKFWFVNDSIGYTIAYYLGTFYVSKTTNGGLNWTQKFASGQVLWEVSFVNKDTGWVCGGEDNGKIWRTTNGGDNFTLQFQTSEVDVIRKIFFLKEKVNGSYKGWWTGYDKMKITTNGGQNWGATILLPESFNPYQIEFINPDTGFMTYSNNIFYKTINGGSNWTGVQANFPNMANSVFSDFNLFNNGKTIFAIGGVRSFTNPIAIGVIYKSTNFGVNWGYQNVDTLSLQIFPYQKIDFINENTGWVYYQNKGYKTTNGGGTVVSISKEQLTISNNYQLYQNYPNPFNPNTTIKFSIPGSQSSIVNLKIFNILGKEVLKIHENKKLESGNYKADIDFTSLNLPSGVYFYTLQITTGLNNFIKTLKMSYVK